VRGQAGWAVRGWREGVAADQVWAQLSTGEPCAGGAGQERRTARWQQKGNKEPGEGPVRGRGRRWCNRRGNNKGGPQASKASVRSERYRDGQEGGCKGVEGELAADAGERGIKRGIRDCKTTQQAEAGTWGHCTSKRGTFLPGRWEPAALTKWPAGQLEHAQHSLGAQPAASSAAPAPLGRGCGL